MVHGLDTAAYLVLAAGGIVEGGAINNGHPLAFSQIPASSAIGSHTCGGGSTQVENAGKGPIEPATCDAVTAAQRRLTVPLEQQCL